MPLPSNQKTVIVFHQELGDRIAYLMVDYRAKTKSKLTLKELALASGVSTGSGMMTHLVSRGTTGIELSKLEKIAEKLGVEVETLAYTGHIDEEDLLMVDSFFKSLKSKPSKEYNMLKHIFAPPLQSD